MFARHTHSRMKVSSVARWKSFIDKLHPQLPLTTKESQRLLTALTSSFRRHLDEAHPTPSAEEERKAKVGEVGVAKPQTRTWHSSASHADKHLASVLTNPLFVKGGKRLDYASAKVALARDPSKDPIELLEEYQQQHAATVPIATMCLQSFMASLKVLTPKEKLARIQEIEPGRRTFVWLLQSGFHNTIHTADNLDLQDLLTHLLVKEGRENNIWQWIEIDTRVSEGAAVDAPARYQGKPSKHLLHAYRWRGRLLCGLVMAKLGYEVDESPSVIDMTKVNDALESFFRACEIKASSSRRDHMYWIPLAAAFTRLARELRRDSFHVKHGLNEDKLERLTSYMPLIFEVEPPIFLKHEIAKIRLIKPHTPSAREAYDLLRDLLGDDQPDDAHKLSTQLTEPRTPYQVSIWSAFIARTIVMLRDQGQYEQASWVESVVRHRCPRICQFVVQDLDRFSRPEQTVGQSEEHEQDECRVPFPTFV